MEYKINSIKVTRNVPIDVRFVVSSINNINVEIPKLHRYRGLMFYCLDEDEIYYFKTNIETPLKLSKEVINSIKFSVENYQQLIEKINDVVDGQIVFVRNLNANFQKVNDKFVYHSGDITVNSLSYIIDLPSEIKPVGVVVTDNSNSKKYFIDTDKTLTDFYKVYQTNPENIVENKIYNVNGIYKLAYNGNLISFGKVEFEDVININKGLNVVTHNLNSLNVAVNCLLNGDMIAFNFKSTSNNEITFNSLYEYKNVKINIK